MCTIKLSIVNQWVFNIIKCLHFFDLTHFSGYLGQKSFKTFCWLFDKFEDTTKIPFWNLLPFSNRAPHCNCSYRAQTMFTYVEAAVDSNRSELWENCKTCFEFSKMSYLRVQYKNFLTLKYLGNRSVLLGLNSNLNPFWDQPNLTRNFCQLDRVSQKVRLGLAALHHT